MPYSEDGLRLSPGGGLPYPAGQLRGAAPAPGPAAGESRESRPVFPGILSSQGTPTMHLAQLPFWYNLKSSALRSLHFFRFRRCSMVMAFTGQRVVHAPQRMQYS